VNKSELIKSLADELDMPARQAASVLSTILNSITDALVRSENVEIRGFGSFVIRNYDSFEGRNPKTHVKVQVESKKMPFFKVGKDLREKVNHARKDLKSS